MIAFILVLVALALLSGFFTLSQIALFSLTTSEVRLQKSESIRRLLSKPRELLVTLLFCDIFANIMIQNTTAHLFGQSSSWAIKIAIPLAIALLFGEIFPKTAGLAFNQTIAPKVAPIIEWVQRILGPLRTFITFITTHISQLLFFFLKKDKGLSNDEIDYVLQASKKNGLLHSDEARLVEGFFSLSRHKIREKMHPRSEILCFDIEAPKEQLIHLFVDKECARVPVYRKELQNLLGICHAIDFFRLKEMNNLQSILKPPFYVPETLSARSLLRQFLQRGETLAMVVDEYGSISGLITKEDVMEMVVGDIVDMRDKKPLYTQSSKDMVISSGRLEISQFEKIFNVTLPSKNKMVTIGGWLTEQMGDIPKTGSHYRWKQFIFQVLSAGPNRVRTVYIKRTKNESQT